MTGVTDETAVGEHDVIADLDQTANVPCPELKHGMVGKIISVRLGGNFRFQDFQVQPFGAFVGVSIAPNAFANPTQCIAIFSQELKGRV